MDFYVPTGIGMIAEFNACVMYRFCYLIFVQNILYCTTFVVDYRVTYIYYYFQEILYRMIFQLVFNKQNSSNLFSNEINNNPWKHFIHNFEYSFLMQKIPEFFIMKNSIRSSGTSWKLIIKLFYKYFHALVFRLFICE